MQIHVVQPNQTVAGIAQAYGITEAALSEANQLADIPNLVVGQALVVPIEGRYYWVRPGDSLYVIGRRVGVSAEELARLNQITPTTALEVGQRIYIPPRPKKDAEVNAYVEPVGETYTEAQLGDVRAAAPRLTYLAPFSFRVQRDGTLAEPPLDDLINIASANKVTPMLVVSTIEEGQFSADLAHLILNDEALRTKLLDNIIATAEKYGFRDIHFDIEFLKPEDREAYNAFLRQAAERIHAAGYLLSTALAPKTSATQAGQWYEAHDYKVHGETVDFVVIMTYEWGYSGGPPMPVSPLPNVREVLDYAVTEIPPEKIMMGQNLYGYDWTLPFKPGGEYAKALSPQDAIALAAERKVSIKYDYEQQAPNFDYTDDQGRAHKVWFEDARSIQAKFNLIKEMNLRGISYWKLGLPFPQNWLLIDDNFNVVTR